jgi:hypothetical protein
LDGARAFVGTVAAVETARCSQTLSVEVPRASELGLSARAQIDLGYCAVWSGKTGDAIDLAVFGPLSGGKVYQLACRLW